VKVLISHAANNDISEIGNWIAADNPQRAVTFMLELQKACQAIGDAPRGSAVVQRYVHFEYVEKPIMTI
jgi:toxin ParE1/3/4